MCIAPPEGPSFLSRLGWGSERKVKTTRVPFKSLMIWEETVFIPPKAKGSPGRVCEASWNTHSGLHPTLGGRIWPSIQNGHAKLEDRFPRFLFLESCDSWHLPVRRSMDYCSPFLSRMTSPSYFVDFPQEASLPSSLVQVSPVGGL